MRNWFGLRFTAGDDPTARWKLQVRENATPAQRAHLAALLAP